MAVGEIIGVAGSTLAEMEVATEGIEVELSVSVSVGRMAGGVASVGGEVRLLVRVTAAIEVATFGSTALVVQAVADRRIIRRGIIWHFILFLAWNSE